MGTSGNQRRDAISGVVGRQQEEQLSAVDVFCGGNRVFVDVDSDVVFVYDDGRRSPRLGTIRHRTRNDIVILGVSNHNGVASVGGA